MEQQVGYKLVEISTGNIVKSWGGTWGQCPSIPNIIELPNGDQVCAPVVGDSYGGYALLPLMMDAPAPTVDDVIFERSVRLAVGFDYDFKDDRGVQHIGTTDQDMKGWAEVTDWANSQTALGNVAATIKIVTDTGSVDIVPLDWMKILNAAGEFRQPIWEASFNLQSMNQIPDDYTDNKWWPK